ncbi:MAG: UDP-N-acetylglucosamine 2-epimerase (non-hydrolyzing) [Oscillospiraceae bacterium]|nr:UDP-N-acetylglucosamine 2-epimerase (non-hydrolyzing) [Oscillospiraceae bacterium]
MKILTVVGARPQFIKAAAVSRALRREHTEILVHTGQHYDYNMSDIFFEELGIPKPDYNLGIAGGTHGKMTGAMLAAVEEVLMNEKPDWLLVYGDTNSTLAAALAAVKLHIPVCHVESGGRLGTLTNPEEVNRICTDHVSSLLLCCTASAVEFLRREGLTAGVHLTGDPMYDAFRYYGERLPADLLSGVEDIDGNPADIPERFYYLTCHREENTADGRSLREIMAAMDQLDAPTVYPVHPRNTERARRLRDENGFSRVLLTKPVGYLTSIALVKGAAKIVTDSGGLQREAFFAGKQCVTVFDYVVWPETMTGGVNRLAKPDAADILEKLEGPVIWNPAYQPFGDGHSSEKITKIISGEGAN